MRYGHHEDSGSNRSRQVGKQKACTPKMSKQFENSVFCCLCHRRTVEHCYKYILHQIHTINYNDYQYITSQKDISFKQKCSSNTYALSYSTGCRKVLIQHQYFLEMPWYLVSWTMVTQKCAKCHCSGEAHLVHVEEWQESITTPQNTRRINLATHR